MKIPYDQLLALILEHTTLSEEEITSKIKAKMDQLAGLISKEGAAHIIANELGVSLDQKATYKLKDLQSGMRDAQVTAKIISVYEPKKFARRDGGEGSVASLLLGDETGKARLVFWNDHSTLPATYKSGEVLVISNPFVKEGQFGMELHYNSDAKIEKSEQSVEITAPILERKSIAELSSGSAELLATIVQVFDPKFYEVCPDCDKRTKPKDTKYLCPNHGEITPKFAYLITLVLDDGTETIRTVFFREMVDTLLGVPSQDILTLRETPESFQKYKDSLLGTIIKVQGRVNKNQLFDRTEFVAQHVDMHPNPEEELKRL